MEHPREVIYLFSGSVEQYKPFYASALIQHDAMLHFCVEHGLSRYNFYGIDGVFDDPMTRAWCTGVQAGLQRICRGTSGRVRTAGQTGRLCHEAICAQAAVAVNGRSTQAVPEPRVTIRVTTSKKVRL